MNLRWKKITFSFFSFYAFKVDASSFRIASWKYFAAFFIFLN
ncbi:hypothetical protein ZPR_1600 [Zunongwangia profunda SM-A87]|uniref:Uncharacterized protein n=1 Tax=Zunongwangia profunda (strain DSM 18752 / CCTCC AB 206139 / SM-A87) TaxID=655815 RepID=D5BL36_ZUNPS|nr:hypothetical protein ZPR_1600 [Zunongwangia profunda SM-A87]